MGETDRMYSNMLDVFSMLSGVDISHKTIQGLCSDEAVMMALNNLHTLLLKKRGVEKSDTSGDGTGYSLTISKHYENVVKELKDMAKEESSTNRRHRKRNRRINGRSPTHSG